MKLALDIIERAYAAESLLRDGSAIVLGGIEEAALGMGPTIGEHRWTAGTVWFAELTVGFIAIDLQDAAIFAQQLCRPHSAAAWHVAIDDGRRVGAAMGTIIANHCPHIAGLGLAGFRREHLCGGLIDEQPGAGEQLLF